LALVCQFLMDDWHASRIRKMLKKDGFKSTWEYRPCGNCSEQTYEGLELRRKKD
jgi:hypothetical protein